ncbi:chemotaxis-specific protein-glutamate methyltransferase CheB [Burkholderia pseudomallei]|nr:chemotaxis response regulator protein-glutamate methylesterase [Burkholderia pseudomallei]ABN88441.1 chemotaxis response regulator protein-glutamate methylesterase [Burkholderia pseudomallei 668]AUG25829.1 chemotaxis response regulator protein-glutamate methylesterase [Burkholderia pseudomallei]EDO86452.1 chemotaxis response regulator protein-glutamate methylesterase [Burkholderia pseudomallei 406e]EDU10495.1 chemotaxis response regulator protein-glutamate methylesterase [Burkholderia pseudo
MIRVVVVDDSMSMRTLLERIINGCDGMTCVGAAQDANAAREMIRALDPDVVTLDVEMPGMDGFEFLRRMMLLKPTPTIMVSGRTTSGSDAALRALELGAVDVIAKPVLTGPADLADYARDIAELIRGAAAARVKGGVLAAASPARGERACIQRPRGAKKVGIAATRLSRVIAIGASTGGTEALRAVLQDMSGTPPPILICQHMPEGFTASFAARLDTICGIRVKEAEQGEPLRYGCAYVAPGHSHLSLAATGRHYVCRLEASPPVNRHRPSVDVLFDSVARLAGKRALGAILTGMGKDGAAGLLRMRASGARTFAQDEQSCVVFGMPKEAIAMGAVDEILPLARMGARLREALQ